jgi:hypothetical protein
MNTPDNTKLLRIAVVNHSTLVEEHVIRRGKSVTVGAGTRNTICLPGTPIGRGFELFARRRGGGYALRFDDTMSGRVAVGQALHSLPSLKSEGRAELDGERWVLPLDDSSRGKITVGEDVLLFQFVKPTPPRPKPELPLAMRGGLLGFLGNAAGLSPTLSGALLLSLVLQIGFIAYVVFEVVPAPRITASDIMEFSYVMHTDYEVPEVEVSEEPPLEMESAVADVETVREDLDDERVDEAVPAEENETVAEAPSEPVQADREELRANARERLDGHRFWGPASNSPSGLGDPLERVLHVSERDLEAVLRRTTNRGDGLASVGSTTLPAERADLIERDVGLGRHVRERISEIGASEERVVRVEPARIRHSRPQPQGPTDPEYLEYLTEIMRDRVRVIRRCYERALSNDSTLGGRLVLEFTIETNGRVSSPRLPSNQLGDVVGACVERRVRSWRFEAPSRNLTVRKTYILAPAGD